MNDAARTWVDLTRNAIDTAYRASSTLDNVYQIWLQQLGSIGRGIGEQNQGFQVMGFVGLDQAAIKRLTALYEEGLSRTIDTARKAHALNTALQAWHHQWTTELVTLYGEQASAGFAHFQKMFSADPYEAVTAEIIDASSGSKRPRLAA